MSSKDYPDHLNPFDDNYTGAAVEPLASNSRQKYNTWSAPRSHRVSTLAKVKPSILGKPWTALNISPNGKLVRRLSILKTAVEKLTTKTKRLSHSTSYTESDLPPRSRSVHEDFAFRIISPKLKERIRQQAFSKAINNQVPPEADPTVAPTSPQPNERLSPPTPDTEQPITLEDQPCPTSPDSEKEIHLGARPKTRKKRPPPPPPPIDVSKTTDIEHKPNEKEKTEDTFSINSSITQDLEKDATSEDENSKAEFYEIRVKEAVQNV